MACSGRGYVTIVGRKRLWSDHLGRGYVTIENQVARTYKGRHRAARAAKNQYRHHLVRSSSGAVPASIAFNIVSIFLREKNSVVETQMCDFFESNVSFLDCMQ